MTAIVRTESEDERTLARLMARVEMLRARVGDVRSELDLLKEALGRFETEYHARVGSRMVELDRIRLKIAEFERRLGRLVAEATVDPEQIARETADDFAADQERLDAEEETVRGHQRDYTESKNQPFLDPETGDELRRVYRLLAKRHHPDLATSDEDRQRREAAMLRINAAYRARDLNALRALANEMAADDPAFLSRPILDRIAWAMGEIDRLDDVLLTLVRELSKTRQSETHQLWVRQEAGEPVVELLEKDLGEEIGRTQERLEELNVLYQRVVARREAA